jgi:KamA family protein
MSFSVIFFIFQLVSSCVWSIQLIEIRRLGLGLEQEIQNLEVDKYKVYNSHNYKKLSQLERLSEEEIFDIKVVSSILPFKANNYVVDQLIDWDNYRDDPIYNLTFPRKEMLKPEHFEQMASLLKGGADKKAIASQANEIRLRLNPHPAGQMEDNVPLFKGERFEGIQHKYKETLLFFPTNGQTCHSYCTFCFRWPQFVKMKGERFATTEIDKLVSYLYEHPEVRNVIFTGGDPMIMPSHIFWSYVEPLLKVPHLTSIRVGTKALAYWPYRFLTDKDAEEMLTIFKKVKDAGKHLAIMAHFTHYHELMTPAVGLAIQKLKGVGVEIRTQSPVLKNINDNADDWGVMWRTQVQMGCVPYYMFVVRDTGAQHHFGMSLERASQIFKDAYKQVCGLARTVRGPSMSAHPGKVLVNGVTEVAGEKVFSLQLLQARNPEFVLNPFFAKYDPNATWLDDLVPAFGESKFFFEKE